MTSVLRPKPSPLRSRLVNAAAPALFSLIACAGSSETPESSDGGGDEANADARIADTSQLTDAQAEANGSSSGTNAESGADSNHDASFNDAGAAPDGNRNSDASSVDCNTLPLCDDFESDIPNMAPDPTLWHVFIGCNPNNANAPVSGGGLTVGIDNSVHHSGSNSLRVVGGDSCGYYAITTRPFSKLGQQVYARYYARFSGSASGADAGAATQGHNGFLSMYSGPTPGTDPNFYTNYNTAGPSSGQLRLGFQSSVIDWNDIISNKDTTLPDLDPMGTALSVSPGANEWDCIELHIDETNNHIEFWFNGVSVQGLIWNGIVTQGVNDQWSTQGPPPLQLQSLGLGWLQLNDHEIAWFDDVALASTRIGCL